MNTLGDYKCECPDPGLSLSSDNKTCNGKYKRIAAVWRSIVLLVLKNNNLNVGTNLVLWLNSNLDKWSPFKEKMGYISN